ncbi:MAG: phage tail protein [Anaerolineales bacterium]
MSDESKYYPHPASYYELLEMGSDDPLAQFDSMTGGDQTISLVAYNVMDDKGNVTTKYMPGQTSFKEITLLRAMDSLSEEMKNRFVDAVMGRLKTVRQNYSIRWFDGEGESLVWWHLYNAVPSTISGFSFNASKEAYYTDFELTLQAESIEIIFE